MLHGQRLYKRNLSLYLYEHGCHRILNSHCCAIFSLQHFTNPIYLMGTILKPYHLQLTPVTDGMGYELWVRFSDKKEDWLGVSLLLDSGDTYCLKFLLCFWKCGNVNENLKEILSFNSLEDKSLFLIKYRKKIGRYLLKPKTTTTKQLQ